MIAFEPGRNDWWSSVVQFLGTLLFNVNTYDAMTTGFESVAYDRLVWTPDAIGSACFLVSGYLDLAAANLFTALGALCFLIGAVLLLPEAARASESAAAPPLRPADQLARWRQRLVGVENSG